MNPCPGAACDNGIEGRTTYSRMSSELASGLGASGATGPAGAAVAGGAATGAAAIGAGAPVGAAGAAAGGLAAVSGVDAGALVLATGAASGFAAGAAGPAGAAGEPGGEKFWDGFAGAGAATLGGGCGAGCDGGAAADLPLDAVADGGRGLLLIGVFFGCDSCGDCAAACCPADGVCCGAGSLAYFIRSAWAAKTSLAPSIFRSLVSLCQASRTGSAALRQRATASGNKVTIRSPRSATMLATAAAWMSHIAPAIAATPRPELLSITFLRSRGRRS